MGAETEPAASSRLTPEFVEQLREAFVSLSGGEFEARLPRSGARDAQDTVAYLFNLMAEELGELFAQRMQHRARMEALIDSVTGVLVNLGAGEFGSRVPRSFDGSPEDVLAYLVNNAAEELQELFLEIERKNAMLEERANRQAMIDGAAYSTLAAGVGHELNNPLSYALGNLEFIELELEQMRVDGNLERVSELAQAVTDTIDGVTRAARIASDLKQLTPAVEMVFFACEPRGLVESALALVRKAIQQRARLECRYDEVPNIRADRGRIAQVLVNLVQNALHALPPERAVEQNLVEITISRHSERMVAIAVRDNGEGVPSENLSRIFDSFFTTRPIGQGTGLGLALCKRMVSDHGGRIEVHSTLGQGSEFRVLIPIAEASP